MRKNKNVQLISRDKKLGRGSAVIHGLRIAFRYKSINYFFEMDSDSAHNPKEAKAFLKAIGEKELDLIIGSRYLKGGKILNFSVRRILISLWANMFLRLWLGVGISDYTGGFRLYNRAAVEYLLKTKLEASGLISLSETLYFLHRGGFKIGEAPITVSARKEGKSTVNVFLLLYSLFLSLN